MNTGIGDAAHLAWKLAMVLRDRASEELLDSYESERSAFARRLVATTDRVFTFATADGPIARLVRTRLVPLVAPAVLGIEAAREFLFRTVGQLALNYRDSPLSSGKAGEVHGGDRMPWVTRDGHDNYEALPPAAWQCQVYGSADDALTLVPRAGTAVAGVSLGAQACGRARCALPAASRWLRRAGRSARLGGLARALCIRASAHARLEDRR
jgi:hypothetical protein